MKSVTETFKEIAREERGKYINKSLIRTGKGFTPFNRGMDYNVPEDRHLLEISYKNHLIQIVYELGNHNLAEIKCEFSSNICIPIFTITTKSHFRRLFQKKINIINITSADEAFKTALTQQLASSGLEKLARTNKFEPKISVTTNSKTKVIQTQYHLEFPDKMQVIQPLLQLYRFLIDGYQI